MRGDLVHQVYGVHAGREKDVFFGAFRTRAEAEAKIAELSGREMHGQNWAMQYHNRGFVIRTVTVDSDFESPSLPKPRDKYFVTTRLVESDPGTWRSTIVEVHRRLQGRATSEHVCEYLRNHGMYTTFEPFRQGQREYALISRDYTKTAVLDLESGEVIAEEEETYYNAAHREPGAGFCPVGFYVPDWWDVNDGSIIPGSEYWSADEEWPTGDFGFVWGCVWGDDSTWKVQLLDLSRIREGIIAREERFGYLELASCRYDPPWQKEEAPPAETPGGSSPPPFIGIYRYDGKVRVSINAELRFDLTSGDLDPDQREALLTRRRGPP